MVVSSSITIPVFLSKVSACRRREKACSKTSDLSRLITYFLRPLLWQKPEYISKYTYRVIAISLRLSFSAPVASQNVWNMKKQFALFHFTVSSIFWYSYMDILYNDTDSIYLYNIRMSRMKPNQFLIIIIIISILNTKNTIKLNSSNDQNYKR